MKSRMPLLAIGLCMATHGYAAVASETGHVLSAPGLSSALIERSVAAVTSLQGVDGAELIGNWVMSDRQADGTLLITRTQLNADHAFAATVTLSEAPLFIARGH